MKEMPMLITAVSYWAYILFLPIFTAAFIYHGYIRRKD
jgi:hypothetical protein